MKKFLSFMFALLLFPAVANADPAVGETFYVGKGAGDLDSNSCATAQTDADGSRKALPDGVNGAISCIDGPGDIVELRAGTYSQDLFNWKLGLEGWNKAGVSGNPITIRGAAGETVVVGMLNINKTVAHDWWVWDNLTFNGTLTGANNGFNTVFTGLMNNVVIKNSIIQNGPRMCLQGKGTFNLITNVEIKDCGVEGVPHFDYGVYWSGADTIFEFIDMHDAAGFGFHIFDSGSNDVARNTVRYSTIRNVGGTEPANAAIIISTGPDNKVYSNLIYDNHRGVQVDYRCHDCQVYNNTIFSNNGVASNGIAIGVSGGSDDVVVKNNIIYSNGINGIDDNGTDTIFTNNHCDTAIEGCGTTTGSSGDPLFTNEGAKDFTLQAGSPVLDKGATLGAPFNLDYLGVLRPQGASYDIGAYERITAAATWELVIDSTNPASAVAMTVSPNSNDGDCTGDTPITSPNCTYNDTVVVTIVAENPEGAGNDFTSWVGCNSVVTVTCTVTMLSNRTVTANYSTPSGTGVANWQCDEGSGTTCADSSPNTNTGTFAGPGGLPTWSTHRGVNVVLFDGVDDQINVAAHATLSFNVTNAFTWRATVLPSSVVLSGQRIVIANNSNTLTWGIMAYDHTACGPGSTTGFFKSTGDIFFNVCDLNPLSATVPTRLGITYDGETLTMYKQGVVVAISTPSAVIKASSTGTVTIGVRASGNFFAGKIWNVILDDNALTPTQMLADAPSRSASGGNIVFGGKFGME